MSDAIIRRLNDDSFQVILSVNANDTYWIAFLSSVDLQRAFAQFPDMPEQTLENLREFRTGSTLVHLLGAVIHDLDETSVLLHELGFSEYTKRF